MNQTMNPVRFKKVIDRIFWDISRLANMSYFNTLDNTLRGVLIQSLEQKLSKQFKYLRLFFFEIGVGRFCKTNAQIRVMYDNIIQRLKWHVRNQCNPNYPSSESQYRSFLDTFIQLLCSQREVFNNDVKRETKEARGQLFRNVFPHLC